MMTRKDFQRLADQMKYRHPAFDIPFTVGSDTERAAWEMGAMHVWRQAVLGIAEACYCANTNFDFDKFVQACCPEGREWSA